MWTWLNPVLRRLLGRELVVYHDPAYRLPLRPREDRGGFELRRADLAAWYLLEQGAVQARAFRRPRRADYAELSLVHPPDFLDALARPETLARVFAVEPADLQVDAVLHGIRLACGATIDAALAALRTRSGERGRVALNLFGGFHHAGRARAGGFCAMNDVAVALAVARSRGFTGQVVVLDLDAHPPDGTVECLRDDPRAWIGSLSGSDFGPLPGGDETLLPPGIGDTGYLAALDGLLDRMPPAELSFVLAGGDVLAGDTLGRLGLTLAGARERDLRALRALRDVPSVWLPSGGYHVDSWRVLAGTGLVLALRSREPISASFDPLVARFSRIARSLDTAELGAGDVTDDEIAAELGMARPPLRLLLGFYTAEGIEHALHRYGVLAELRKLGYGPFRVQLGADGLGERVRVFGSDRAGSEQLLAETVLEKQKIGDATVLYVHWVTLRDPQARFSTLRPRLPGQDVPGLGLSREVSELFTRMAERLGLDGVAYRPAAYHTAYPGRAKTAFLDPARQGRFEALVRDLEPLQLLDATRALAEGRVRMNGEPYAWEPDELVLWLQPRALDSAAVAAERERVRFTVVPT